MKNSDLTTNPFHHKSAHNEPSPQMSPTQPDVNASSNCEQIRTIYQAIGFGISGFILLTIFAIYISHPAEATTEIPQVSINLDDVDSGQLLLRSENVVSSALLLTTDVKVTVSGTVSRTTVSQRFINTGTSWAEGVYAFPVGENAAVDSLKMRIGDRFIEGQIKERKAAKIAYETAKSEGKKASLIEQKKPNLFTNTIANIGPGEIVTVQIEFQSKISPRDGYWDLRIPLVSAPQFMPLPIVHPANFAAEGIADGASTEALEQPRDIKIPQHNELINPVDISIDLKPGFTLGSLESQFHQVNIQEVSRGRYKIDLNGPVSSDRDFVLRWTANNKDIETSLFKEAAQGADHLLLTLTPPFEIDTAYRPAREIIFVQDISGSMSGEPLRQSKLGLEMALQRLKPTDNFNLVFFDNSYFSYAVNPVPATPAEKAKAIKLVRNMQSRGGTEMYPALSYALRNFSNNTAAIKQLIFLTDGAVSGENSLFPLISNNLGTARLFTIGIGSAPNSYFMSRAAEIGRGSHLHIGKTSEISEKMNKLFLKIENPAVTDLKLTLPEGFDAEFYPNPLPDLYVGDPVAIAIKGQNPNGMATLNGKIGTQDWTVKVPLDQATDTVGIAKVWARDKIANLERSLIAQSGDADSRENLEAELLHTALSYGMVSRLSSLVALDVTPARPVTSRLVKSKLPTAIPHGWDTSQFEFERADVLPPKLQKIQAPTAKLHKASLNGQSTTHTLPQTAMNWRHKAFLALLSLFLGMALLWISREPSHA